MKQLYLDCGMGAAGDMLTAALLELIPEQEKFIEKMNSLGIPGVTMKKERAVKAGITGTHVSVKIEGREEGEEHDHHHHGHGHDGEHEHEYDHDDEHGHEHEHSHDVDHGHEHEHSHDVDHGHEHEHSHDHEHGHSHDHEHEHSHEHTHDHDHNHDHGHHHHHHHSGMSDIRMIVAGMDIPSRVKEDILAVYGIIAEAESHVHGEPVEQIHFHEVGDKDAIADITAVCLLMDQLRPDQVVVSPVCTGSGRVRCAHGLMPVPAPATAYILQGIPAYSGTIKSELCTPTGAALLKYFADRFGEMPVMRTEAIGYGCGKKDFEAANCVRAMIGESEDRQDIVLELSANVDDMTAEAVGFAVEQLFAGGAREVYTVPVGMKKSRPGTLIRVMCTEDDREKMLQLLFRHTTTLGVRESVTRRYILDRHIEETQTPYGAVRIKKSAGYGVSRLKYEYEDIARIARETGKSLHEVEEELGRL